MGHDPQSSSPVAAATEHEDEDEAHPVETSVAGVSPLIASRAVVVSAFDGHAQRHPPTIRWYEPLTLAEVDSFRQVSQREWVRRIAALHVVAGTAGHFVHRDQPDLVAHVAGAVVDAARRGAPVDLVGVDLAAAVGRLRPARS
jgi:hypothetical protein